MNCMHDLGMFGDLGGDGIVEELLGRDAGYHDFDVRIILITYRQSDEPNYVFHQIRSQHRFVMSAYSAYDGRERKKV